MTNEKIAKHLRILRQHCETVAARCKAVEDAVMRGEMFGIPISESKIHRQVRDIENRITAAAALIGVRHGRPPKTQKEEGA